MKKFYKRIGLIKDFEIWFPIDRDEAIGLLRSDNDDIKINLLDKVFGKEIPFNSIDFKFDNGLNEFSTNRDSYINPNKGRAKIIYRLELFEKNKTCIKGIIESYYSDLKFPAILYGIFISIMTLTIISSDNYGIEWIFYISGFFLITTSLMIVFQRFELRNAEKALMKYLVNKITNAKN